MRIIFQSCQSVWKTSAIKTEMSFVRVSRCTYRGILFSLCLTLVTLLFAGNHIYKPENRYTYDLNAAVMTNVTPVKSSHARRAQLFLQKNKTQVFDSRGSARHLQNVMNSRSADKTMYHNESKAVIVKSLHTGHLPNNSSQSVFERKREKISTKNDITRENRECAKIVIILAYMHTGSSYTARIIQNHPGTFYEFEPLRSLQESSRRGTWIQYLNGTKRRVSGEVIDANVGAEAVYNTVTCNHQNLDIATLSTSYLGVEASDNRDIKDYFRCQGIRPFTRTASTRDRRKYRPNVNEVGHSQTGRNMSKLNHVNFPNERRPVFINRQHWSKRQADIINRARNLRLSQTLQNPVVEKNIQSCLPRLIDRCRNATTRLTKYIRMTMEMVEGLLDKVGNLRVIHLLRDPRAMMDSQLRKNDMNVKSFPVFQRRTRYMCTRMNMDLDIAEKLKKSYPGQIFTLRYEDLVDDPLKTSQKLFNFIDIPFTSADKKFITSTSIETVKDSKYRASVWRSHITSEHLNVVNRYCYKLYNTLGYISFEHISDVRDLKLPDHFPKGNIISSLTNGKGHN
ncbi:uncharacterized protein LOC123556378 [Mercenaria mercenaria]|uniref:uncharacterized protein LOC123556378 n=1 Tax=Mercenaria mercenaria TaxID=6596 RepID=UPI00234E6BDC|nr:uncharacterized protein LOC123556378 [Mercenaria mercenaria]